MTTKENVTIKKNEYGFFNNITIPIDSKIICLTGVNGVGKSKVLEKIAITNKKSSIFTTTNLSNTKSKNNRPSFFRYRYEEDNRDSLSEFLKEITNSRNFELLGVHSDTDIKNTLFADNSANEHNKEELIKEICNRIKQQSNKEVEKRFLNSFLIPTNEDIEQAKIALHTEHYQKTQKQSGTKDGSPQINSINLWLKEQEDRDKEGFNKKVKKKAIKNIKENKKITQFKKKDIEASYNAFITKLKEEVFDEIDIEDLITDITKRIKEDFQSNSNNKKYKFLYDKINNTINYYFDKPKDEKLYNAFPYHIVKPSTHGLYTLEFKYKEKCKGLENNSLITFSQLSTGEKNIFTLLVYKYLLTQDNHNYKYLLLDEFDANLNPAFTKFYIDTLKHIAKESKVIIIFTTHSYITLCAANKYFKAEDYKLYQITKDIEKKKHEYKEKQNDFDNFIEEYSADILPEPEPTKEEKDKIEDAKYVIITEGPTDYNYITKYIEKELKKEEKDYYIQSHEQHNEGKDSIEGRMNAIKKKKDKIIVGLFDFDKAWNSFKKSIDGKPEDDFWHLHLSEDNKDKNNDHTKIYIVHKPITKKEFDEQCKKCHLNIEYPYSNTVNEVVLEDKKKEGKKKKYEIEDLIVSYNIKKYKDYKDYYKHIKDFFKIDSDDYKKKVEAFFNTHYKDDDFNFKGFEQLFESIKKKKDVRP